MNKHFANFLDRFFTSRVYRIYISLILGLFDFILRTVSGEQFYSCISGLIAMIIASFISFEIWIFSLTIAIKLAEYFKRRNSKHSRGKR